MEHVYFLQDVQLKTLESSEESPMATDSLREGFVGKGTFALGLAVQMDSGQQG